MLKLNKTTEYGLMAISYIRDKSQGEVSSAREIADFFDLPFEILAKTLQKLKDQGVITSTYGTRGGYVLNRDLATLNLADFLGMMEGPLAVVSCSSVENREHSNCEYFSQCNIHPMMAALNSRLYDFLHRISIDELTRAPVKVAQSTAPLAALTQGLQGEEP